MNCNGSHLISAHTLQYYLKCQRRNRRAGHKFSLRRKLQHQVTKCECQSIESRWSNTSRRLRRHSFGTTTVLRFGVWPNVEIPFNGQCLSLVHSCSPTFNSRRSRKGWTLLVVAMGLVVEHSQVLEDRACGNEQPCCVSDVQPRLSTFYSRWRKYLDTVQGQKNNES